MVQSYCQRSGLLIKSLISFPLRVSSDLNNIISSSAREGHRSKNLSFEKKLERKCGLFCYRVEDNIYSPYKEGLTRELNEVVILSLSKDDHGETEYTREARTRTGSTETIARKDSCSTSYFLLVGLQNSLRGCLYWC